MGSEPETEITVTRQKITTLEEKWEPAIINSKETNILNKIQKAQNIELNLFRDTLPQERVCAIESLLKLYFELGQEVYKNSSSRSVKLSTSNESLVQDIAWGISENSFKLESFIRHFASNYLDYGKYGGSKLNCVLISGLHFMFDLIGKSNIVLHYSDEDVHIIDVLRSLKEEASFDEMMEDFKHWWKSECYLEKHELAVNVPVDHWWWR